MSVAHIVPNLARAMQRLDNGACRRRPQGHPRVERLCRLSFWNHWCMHHEVLGPICGPPRTRPDGGRGPIPGRGAPGKSAHSARNERCRRGVHQGSAPATLLAPGVILSAEASDRTGSPTVHRRRPRAVALDVAPSVIRTARPAGDIRPPSGPLGRRTLSHSGPHSR